MAVLTVKNIYIVNLERFNIEHMIRDIYENNFETFDLTETFLAYQGEKGVVDIYDVEKMELYVNINAHNNNIACLKFNKQSNAIATCSIVGTIIRIYKVVKKHECIRLLELRVTYKRYNRVRSIIFSPCVCFLAVVNFDEIKLFFLKEKISYNYISEATTSLAYSLARSILPCSVNELIRQKTSTNTINFNSSNTFVKSMFKFHYGHLYLLVAFNTDCFLKIYKLNSKNYNLWTDLVETIPLAI